MIDLMLRFAILKEIETGLYTDDDNGTESKVILEYNETQILTRLQSRIREELVQKESFFKRSFNKTEINNAFHEAFEGLVTEFKERTITLK